MPANLFSNDSIPHLQSPSGSGDQSTFHCHITTPSSLILSAYYITNIIFLLPLCILILHHGFKQWQQKRSTSSAAPATSHSDCFTYHLVTMELINVLNYICYCCGIYRRDVQLLFVCSLHTSLIWHGQIFFHTLTCLEHYLAVVHPVTYLSLKQERGIRIRNITIGCVWPLCFAGMGLMVMKKVLAILDLCILVVNITLVSFCSLSVLRVLIRPGPGEQSGGRRRPDQSKQRAFYTIVTILGVLVLRCIGNVIWTMIDVLRNCTCCLMMTVGVWINLPSSLVLPLLFLHREGKLTCYKNDQ